MSTSRLMQSIAATGLLGLAVSAWAPAMVVAEPPSVGEKSKAAPMDDGSRDRLVFKSGKSAEGKILEETETTIKMRVFGAGGLSVETVYNKSEILTIEREVVKAKTPAADKPADAAPAAAPEAKKPDAAAAKEGAQKVYLIDLQGEFGRDVSVTPLRQILKDAKAARPDVIIFKMDTKFSVMGEERPDFVPDDAGPAFNQLETARELSTLFTDDIRDDPEWKTDAGDKPRMVCWVNKALGGAAFVPFVFPEIYYTSGGIHGGLGGLERMFDGVGDKVAQEKQYSLRLKRAEGLAIKGGHNPLLVRAMARNDYVLSVKYEGGKPIFLERMPESPDEELLTDDGDEQSGHADLAADVIRYRGNDVLTLHAEQAYKLGLSNGTADTIDDLMYKLGISRSCTMIKGRAEQILKDWSKAVSDSERNFRRLWEEFARVTVAAPGGYRERTAARGRQIKILTEIKGLLDRYKEAINPRAIQGAPEAWETNINLMIEQIKTAQRLDRDDRP